MAGQRDRAACWAPALLAAVGERAHPTRDGLLEAGHRAADQPSATRRRATSSTRRPAESEASTCSPAWRSPVPTSSTESGCYELGGSAGPGPLVGAAFVPAGSAGASAALIAWMARVSSR